MASPLDLLIPPRLLLRALDDLHTLALVAREVQVRIESLDARAAEVQHQLDMALELGRSIERRGKAIADAGALLEARGAEMTVAAEAILEALPLLERAIKLGEPLEGAVERLGRVVDRLPGGPNPRRAKS